MERLTPFAAADSDHVGFTLDLEALGTQTFFVSFDEASRLLEALDEVLFAQSDK